jgi:hypothetical protein
MRTEREGFDHADDLVREALQLGDSFRHIDATELPPEIASFLEKARACQEARAKADSYRYRNCLTAVTEAEEQNAMHELIKAHQRFVAARRHRSN